MATNMSAISDEPIEVLFALHQKFDLLEFAGIFEGFARAHHDNDPNSKAFECTIAGPESKVLSDQGVIIDSQITYADAHRQLKDFTIVVVVGGDTADVLEKGTEPLTIIKAFATLQEEDSSKERTLLAGCGGALLLARQGILSGLSATTHPDLITKFENICSKHAATQLVDRTDVVEDARYVVNNLRFDLGEDENPYIRRKSDATLPTKARKGSMSFKGSNTRRESIARRAAMRLGGLRVITTSGVSAGVDAALYLISALVSNEAATEVARCLQWTWIKGVVVDGLDV